MKILRRLTLTGLSAAALASALVLPAGCGRKAPSAPLPFTGQLLEIDGSPVALSLRHPKLILEDLDKLMAGVPEASLLRMVLGQLTPYGYPEFTEIAAGSNIGLVLVNIAGTDLPATAPEPVFFARLKEGGKIWSLLTAQKTAFKKHGDWVLFAKTPGALDAVKSPDAVIAWLSRPLTALKNGLTPLIQTKLATTKLDAAQQKAALQYVDVIYGLIAQLHSADASLDLNDTGLTLTYGYQFQPETPIGTFLRHPLGEAPAAAQWIEGDTLFNATVHQNTEASTLLFNQVFDALIAVDYPVGATSLKELKTAFALFNADSNGGGVMTFNMSFPATGGSQPPAAEFFGVNPGKFTTKSVRAYYRSTQTITRKFTDRLLPLVDGAASTDNDTPKTAYSYSENALVIDGATFDLVDFGAGKAAQSRQYFGVVKGDLVYADSEATLRKHLPALLARKPLPHSIAATNPLKPDEFMSMTVNGSGVVDTVVKSTGVDLSDEDLKAQVDSLKAAYAKGAPVKISGQLGQAKATMTFTVPYAFIAASVRLGQFANTHKAAPASP